jgi:DNA primase catalytic core
MPRIAESEITRIKQESNLKAIIESKGINLKGHGENFIGLCPFHNDTNPSLVVTPKKGLWHCLGACNSGGSVFDWVMKAEGVSFRHAYELLRQDNPSFEKGFTKTNTIPKLKNPFSTEFSDSELLTTCLNFYHDTLLSDTAARKYLAKRKLDDEELIKTFKLGYANRTLGLRLPHKNRTEGAELRTRLQNLGIFRESGHEHFAGSIVIGVFNGEEVQEAYGRKIRHNLRPGTQYHTYLPGPHKGIFNQSYFQNNTDCDTLILCESLIDALSFYRFGFCNVTSSFGVNGYTDELHSFLSSGQFKQVIMAYDADIAGNEASLKAAERLNEEGVEVKRLFLPNTYDVNQLVVEQDNPQKALQQALDHSTWLGIGALYTEEAGTSSQLSKGSGVHGGNVSSTNSSAPQITTKATTRNPVPNNKSAEGTEGTSSHLSRDSGVHGGSISSANSSAPQITKSTTRNPTSNNKTSEASVLLFQSGDRHYRIAGLYKNRSLEVMKINLKVSQEEAFFVDTLDLYLSKARQSYISQASIELGEDKDTLKKDLAKLLNALEEEQERAENEALDEDISYTMSDEEKEEALHLLKQPELLNTFLNDMENMGLVGEELNKLIALLCMSSRKLTKPLALIVQSSSSGGKSTLLDGVLAMFPEEESHRYSSMSGQSLFYMGEKGLKHKILYIAEEEGAKRASYSLKVLQSDGELTMASTGKDPISGRLITQEYKTEGPVQLCMTTTSIELDAELQNRCLVLSVDESRAQTRAIQERQRLARTRSGMIQKEQAKRQKQKWQNAQRLLNSYRVVNPFAGELCFLDEKTRMRRDQEKYLDLMDSIALLFQYQKEVKEDAFGEYIEVSLDDIELANSLASYALGKSLDELPPQTRILLEEIYQMVTTACVEKEIDKERYRFSRREVREYTQWGNTQIRIHLDRLQEMEYLIAHKGKRGQSFVYELNYQPEGAFAELYFLPGLLDIQKLIAKYPSCQYDGKFAGLENNLAGLKLKFAPSKRPQNGGMAGQSISLYPLPDKAQMKNRVEAPEITYRDEKKQVFAIITTNEVKNGLYAPE